ncbi:ROK family protein [Paenibacillus fonticola]|uniref:ROK family protein n=1 Tax=Paenibacillus fonticola TaxID=379896 RepID=UPI000379C6C6|nr:ROK family protein [Paenibacillus fonticola]
MDVKYALGIDIGGTKTAIGIVDSMGTILAKMSLPTDLSIDPRIMISRTADAAKQLLADQHLTEAQIAGIGVGAPGPLNTKTGHIVKPPNMTAWHDFPLMDALKSHFSLPIIFENDATAAALAEKWQGAAQECEHFIFITISTGIGAGIYSHGKLITGATGNAGDVGHLVIDPSAGDCVCGQQGCWEFIASGTAIARQASRLLDRDVTSKEVFDLAQEGHAEMKRLVDQVFRYIGMGCVTLINTLDPEKVVIGGGVSQVGDPLFHAVRDYVKACALNPSGQNTPIVPAALNQDAGLIGAAALIHMEY